VFNLGKWYNSSGDIPKMLSEAYPTFASFASNQLSQVLTKAVIV